MNRDVCLYVPHNGWVRTEFMASVLQVMHDPDGCVAEFNEMQCGPVMGQARCAIVAEFLKTPLDWLLMIDSDMKFTPGTIRALRAAADEELRPVVGALCMGVSGDGVNHPTMYRADKSASGEFGFTSWTLVPPAGVVEVDATGAACVLIHRSVFKRLDEFADENRQLWFGEMNVGHRIFGEDFSFCIRCRAAGIPVHVCTTARTGHVKSVILGEAGP